MMTTTEYSEGGFPLPPDEVIKQSKSIWDCVDPCAFVCYSISIGAIPLDDTVKQTLDSFGWLTPEGYPDYALMRRQFEKKA